MDFLSLLLSYVVLLVMVLVSVAFVTLLEQKILAGTQIRVGPNYVGYWGLLQPFSDAVKLFNKESLVLRSSNSFVYYLSPVISLSLSLVLWLSLPFLKGGYDYLFSILFFILVSGVGVYPILSSGWSSNCKYSVLGSLRGVAQMVSYEVSLVMILLSVIWFMKSFNMSAIIESNNLSMFIVFLPLGCIWFVSALAETNRTPYDFSESESELVSGFNTEYSAGGFTLIFMAEYGNILFMSVFFCILFLSSGSMNAYLMIKGVLVSCFIIWVRGTLPRFRYDKLMSLTWKSFLPISLFFFFFFVWVVMIM